MPHMTFVRMGNRGLPRQPKPGLSSSDTAICVAPAGGTEDVDESAFFVSKGLFRGRPFSSMLFAIFQASTLRRSRCEGLVRITPVLFEDNVVLLA